MSDRDICFLPLSEVADFVRTGEISPVEVVQRILDRIERVGPRLNCYISVLFEQALRRAKELETLLVKGDYLGPLHGIPISVKDNIETAQVRTTAGSPILADWIPSRNAAVVARLQAAGAVLVAKANLWEFADGAPHQKFGPTHNPWSLERTCGGSSTGSAASVAGGLCYGSIGTDTGGSIRIPAAFCGIVGLRATYGRVSRAGILPGGYSLDQAGPMTRTVRDAALILQEIAGRDTADPTTVDTAVPDFTTHLEDGVNGLRIGIPRLQTSELIDPEVQSAVQRAFAVIEQEGAVLTEVQLPDLIQARTLLWTISAPEASEFHRVYLRTRGSEYHPMVRSLLEAAEFVPATEYVHAQRVRQRMIEDLRSALTEVDALMLPVVPVAAYPLGTSTLVLDGHEEDALNVIARYTPLFSLTGHPSMSVPCGFTSGGLPVGLQIVGQPFDEAAMLRVARAHELATNWHLAHPPV